MVRLKQPQECDHLACPGDVPVPQGMFGGSHCLCLCHQIPEQEKPMTPRSEKAIHSCNAEVIERLQAEVESLREEKAGLIELCAAKIKGPLNALEAITKL